ncbi:hypothetical protein [Thermoanaerobacterium butyriciformans]|uniref:DUF4190 domain-containing protein n=1 Tax=Thermoanaerobacterium butyriciformans TaxID=1702242 RepID=A0ABS4NB04_9THEO|nr:hypothetical protein [Thermoanaerobacterium butyriciformans]MBP2070860.1 hypothetical protein [Thermoanaerobacterium butyriciformans]
MNRFVKGFINGFKSIYYIAPAMFFMPSLVLAGTTATDTTQVANSIIQTVGQFAMPIGMALVFVGLLISTIKIIASHGKAQKRSEALEGIGWLIGATIGLGLIITIFGAIVTLSGYTKVKSQIQSYSPLS